MSTDKTSLRTHESVYGLPKAGPRTVHIADISTIACYYFPGSLNMFWSFESVSPIQLERFLRGARCAPPPLRRRTATAVLAKTNNIV
eukprot:7150545-Heterocapsa_arctica.AAC.1